MFSFLPSGLHGLSSLLIYLGAILVFVLSALWRPQVGLYFLLPLLPLQTVRYRIHDYPFGEKLVDFVLLGIVIGLLLHRDGAGWVRTPMTRTIILWGMFLYVSLVLGAFYLGGPWPIDPSSIRFSEWKNYIELPFLVFVTAGAIRDRRQMKICLLLMGLSFFVVNRNFYSTVSGRDLSSFSYEVRDAGAIGYAGVNGLAAFEATCMLFMMGLLSLKMSRYYKWLLYGLLLTGVYCLLYSFSRGGYVGFLLGLVYLGIVRQRKLLVLVAVLLIGWQVFLPASVQQRITMTYDSDDGTGGLDQSAKIRVDLFTEAENLIKANPILGTGFDTYAYMGGHMGFRDTHDYFLKMLLETGVIGLLFFLYVVWRMFALGIRLFRRSDDPFLSVLGLSFSALMIGMIGVNIFGDRWTYLQVDSYMWILLGLVARGLIINEQEAAEKIAAAPVQLVAGAERASRKLVPNFGISKQPGLVPSR